MTWRKIKPLPSTAVRLSYGLLSVSLYPGRLKGQCLDGISLHSPKRAISTQKNFTSCISRKPLDNASHISCKTLRVP